MQARLAIAGLLASGLGMAADVSTSGPVTFNKEVLPILQKQPGFVDLIALEPEDGSDRQLSISFWNNKQDAERYQRDQYSRIVDSIKPLLKRDPQVQTYNVAHSTPHRISASKVAA